MAALSRPDDKFWPIGGVFEAVIAGKLRKGPQSQLGIYGSAARAGSLGLCHDIGGVRRRNARRADEKNPEAIVTRQRENTGLCNSALIAREMGAILGEQICFSSFDNIAVLNRRNYIMKTEEFKGYAEYEAEVPATLVPATDVRRSFQAPAGKGAGVLSADVEPLREFRRMIAVKANRTRLEAHILLARQVDLGLGRAAHPTIISADMIGRFGDLACERKFYNALWCVHHKRVGAFLAKNETLNGDWSQELLPSPHSAPEGRIGDRGSSELQYDRLVEQETASDEAYEVLESKLVFARILYINETYQENWRWTFKTYRFSKTSGGTLVILRELYQSRLAKSKS
jgi:hypothetical protein